jgi:hypothetical protein
MRRIRVSVLGSMGLVLICALWFAGLRSYSKWWVSGLFTLSVVLVGLAALIAVVRDGRIRAAAAGFAIFGGGYLLLVFGFGSFKFGMHMPPLLIRVAVDEIEKPLFQEAQALEAATKNNPRRKYMVRNNFGYNELDSFDDVIVITHTSNNTPLPQPLEIYMIEAISIRCKLQCLAANLVGVIGAGLGVAIAPRRI